MCKGRRCSHTQQKINPTDLLTLRFVPSNNIGPNAFIPAFWSTVPFPFSATNCV